MNAIIDTISDRWDMFIPVGIIGALSWGIWVFRKLMSLFYRPIINDYRTTTSLVVPSFREDPDILLECLQTWLAQNPTEIIIVLDLEDTEAQRRLLALNNPRLNVIMFAHEGKRSALGVGIKQAKHNILVLTDSDTRWQPGLLAAVQMPFVDPTVGGVGTRQNVYLPYSSVWRRVADWIIDLRYMDYVPATSRKGGVVCLSGRTAAYRRAAVIPVLENLEYEYFFNKKCIAGDDGRLTWLVLAQGYKTVHQDTARALSMFPTNFKSFVKQRIRWSRNSYRCYLTCIYKGWLWRVPFISQLTVFQILFTPVTMFAAVYYVASSWFSPQRYVALTLGLSWMFLGRAIRSISHLRSRPADLLLLPLVTLVIAFVALPIKTIAFFTMNKQGWMTRRKDIIGGEGQDNASLKSGASGGAAA
ncbi:glycosyltransferase [Pseudonocardia acaciae]|uniref:glycosyltransferase n=1 Tax=Pseudonocardia acaciae TaxID=551276 RepID=UPI000688AA04|nr:glycosyltransferase [Pseudonocardia acaciae]